MESNREKSNIAIVILGWKILQQCSAPKYISYFGGTNNIFADCILLFDETELRTFFVAITALSIFIICLFFIEGEKNRESESDGDKKMHGVPFHPIIFVRILRELILPMMILTMRIEEKI